MFDNAVSKVEKLPIVIEAEAEHKLFKLYQKPLQILRKHRKIGASVVMGAIHHSKWKAVVPSF